MKAVDSVQVNTLARQNIANILCVDSYDSAIELCEDNLSMTTAIARKKKGLEKKASLSSIVSIKAHRVAPVRGSIILMLKNNARKGKK